MPGSSPATPGNALSCQLPAPARSAGRSSQALCWLLHRKPEALRTSEVQVLFANIKYLPSRPGGPEQRTLCVSVESAKQSVRLVLSSSFHEGKKVSISYSNRTSKKPAPIKRTLNLQRQVLIRSERTETACSTPEATGN